MDRIPPILISRAWHIRTMLEHLDRVGVPWQRRARRHGLPGQLPEPSSCLPTAPYLRLVGDLAAQQNYFELSAKASLDPDGQLAIWEPIPYLVRASLSEPSLYQCLETLCELATTQWSGVVYWLRETDDSIWLCSRYRVRHSDWSTEQFLQGRVMQTVALIERYLGSRWRPESIRLECGRLPSPLFADIMACDRIDTGCKYTAIEIPRAIVAQSGPVLRGLAEMPTTRERIDLAGLSWMQRLWAVLPQYVLAQCVTIEQVAGVLCVSPRTLQRALREQGLTFRLLLDNVRLELAKRLLADPGLSVEEIGRALGYSEPTNFARAFRRSAGCSPGQYRLLLVEGTVSANRPSPSPVPASVRGATGV